VGYLYPVYQQKGLVVVVVKRTMGVPVSRRDMINHKCVHFCLNVGLLHVGSYDFKRHLA
jgi:hypothetical protein